MEQDCFVLEDSIRNSEYLVASYYLELPKSLDSIYEIATKFAVGQTIGTWTPVPGVTAEMRERYMGKVVQIYNLPPDDLSYKHGADANEKEAFIICIAYPAVNLNGGFPMLLTTLLGNDASTSTQAKLIELRLPEKYSKSFSGPKFGIEGIRELIKVEKRPLLLNMIKPCLGFTPQVGARIFYETALGGLDFIKDDELLGNPDYCPLTERIRLYREASEAAFQESGKKTIYIPNITDRVDRIFENLRIAEETGAEMIMLNFASVGLDILENVVQKSRIPIFVHSAGSGPYYEGRLSGLSSSLYVGKFARVAGADMVMINTPYGGYPLRRQKYLRTAHELGLPSPYYKPVFPVVGGGVKPSLVPTFIRELGKNIVIAAGGSIQGHPQGASAGAKAMMQAVEAEVAGISLSDYAVEKKELRLALEAFK